MAKAGPVSKFWERLGELVGSDFASMTQAEVGKIFGVGQSMATRWKTGKDLPAFTRVCEIAIEHGVCVEWLLTGRGPKTPGPSADPELARLLEFWDKLLPDTRRNVVGYAVLQRSIQTTAPPERIKAVHDALPAANHKARQGTTPRR